MGVRRAGHPEVALDLRETREPREGGELRQMGEIQALDVGERPEARQGRQRFVVRQRVGPGLSQAAETRRIDQLRKFLQVEAAVDLLERVLQLDAPLVIDADAITLLARRPEMLSRERASRCVMTPRGSTTPSCSRCASASASWCWCCC